MHSALGSTFLKVGVLVIAAQALVPPSRAQDSARFAATWPMKLSRAQHTATLLTDGRVLLAGGTVGDWAGTVTRTTEIFDPATGTFSAGPDMIEGRRMHSATLLADGRVLIAGGFNGGVALSSAELYDPSTGTFSRTGNLVVGRGWHDAILLSVGTVLIVGGTAGFWPEIPAAEIFNPTTGTFGRTGEYVGHGACDFCPPAVALADGRVLFIWQNPAQIYDPAMATFTASGSNLITAPSTAALMLDGRVLLTGGEDLGRSALAAVFHPVYGTFTRTGSMAAPRVFHSLTLLPDGTVLAAGGETDACNATWCFFAGSVASAELYNPWTGRFTSAGSMVAARETHTATLLNDGRVLLAGGISYGGIDDFRGGVGSAELYTPSRLIPAPTLLSVVEDENDPRLLELSCVGLNDGSVVLPQITVGGRFARIVSLSDADSAGVRVMRVEVQQELEVPAPMVVQVRYIGRTSNEFGFVPRKRSPRWVWSHP
jgi:hypothetical protein